MKKILMILAVSLVLVFSFNVVNVNAFTYEGPGGIGIDRPDGPCPYYIGDHKLYSSGVAGVHDYEGDFIGFFTFFYCDCGYYMLTSGSPEDGYPIYDYVLPEEMIYDTCQGGVLFFDLTENGTVGYTTSITWPSVIFYDGTPLYLCALAAYW
ncbi:hypothetical protein RJI07_07210 [Mycoplasmatota bacterium WC30]